MQCLAYNPASEKHYAELAKQRASEVQRSGSGVTGNAPDGSGNAGGFRTEPGEHLVASSIGSSNGGQHLEREYVSATPDTHGVRTFTGLPKGLDSPRYRALGNAVTQTVAFWIARRLAYHIRQNPQPRFLMRSL